MAKEKKAPKMTIGRATLLGLMRRYLSAVMDPAVSLLEIHKLMYFMQEAGEPLKLTQQRPVWPLCRKFAPRSQRHRRPFHQRIWRRRRQSWQIET